MCATLTVLLAVLFPRGNIFLSELVPEEYYSFFPVGLLITLIHIKLLPALYFNVALAATLLVVYMYYLTVLTGELTFNKLVYNTIVGFRSYRNNENLQVPSNSSCKSNGDRRSYTGVSAYHDGCDSNLCQLHFHHTLGFLKWGGQGRNIYYWSCLLQLLGGCIAAG